MIVKNPKFEITAVDPAQYPINSMPDVCFVGRSNVGKSSLINTMVNRKNLARVGGTPGKTRVINFFNIDDTLYFVDLPGYGYAKVSKEEKASWGKLADTYLTSRSQLALIIMLVDLRHAPTEDDKVMYNWILSTGFPHIIAATKSDKITRSKVNNHIRDIKETLNLGDEVEVIPFSSKTRQGKDELWDKIDSMIGIG